MSTLFPKSAWRYGVQIIILFAIAALTSALIIRHLEENLIGLVSEDVVLQMNISIWTLTMGFMFLAGALGLWAIRSTCKMEGKRSIGRFVDAMESLNDGLFVLDKRGVIIGSNPAARSLFQCSDWEQRPVEMSGAFPFLTQRDAELLLCSKEPCEVYADYAGREGLRTLRFRSQPSESVVSLLVSDVTEARSHEIRRRQIAQLQLVGRIAGGVANDFNDILCSISGHSALLNRPDLDPVSRNNCLEKIGSETRRGALLSRMLIDLSRSGKSGNPSDNLAGNVTEAGALLRVALAPGWTVKIDVRGRYPTIPLASSQVEQIILSLGMLAADSVSDPNVVLVTLNPPGSGHLLDVGNRFVAVILISAHVSEDLKEIQSQDLRTIPVRDESGVILSVVGSMVEEAGGRIDHLTAPGGLSVYRVCLPHLDTRDAEKKHILIPPSELNVYISRWKVLLGGSGDYMDSFGEGLRGLGTIVEKKKEISSLLSRVQAVKDFDAVVLDKELLGAEPESLLQAITKLAPRMGIVVLSGEPERDQPVLQSAAILENHEASPDKVIRAMIEAKTQARVRSERAT